MNCTTLFAVYKDQPPSEVFADYYYHGQDGETWEKPYEQIAKMAKPEEWSFNRE